MKLQNKKTGFVTDWCIDKDVIRTCDGSIVYNSIAELNKDWEDYEEPKTYWVVDYITCGVDELTIKPREPEMDDFNKEIGNYFETKEDAEKAVKKLKAWKRLKDKGFKFGGHDDRDRGQLGDIVIYAEMPTFEYDDDSTRDDLDLLFDEQGYIRKIAQKIVEEHADYYDKFGKEE